MDEPGRDSEGVAPRLDLVGELMESCLALPEAEQPAALERLCAGHPELAEELRARFQFLAGMGLGPQAKDPAQDLPEQLGEFKIVERLGGGGMGVVLRAKQTSLGREVALKLVRPELLWFDGARERFRREIESVAKLHHPGIVPVFVAGEEKGVPFFAMELVVGCTLAEAIAALSERAPESLTGADLLKVARAKATDPPPIPPRFAGSWVDACVEVARQVADALEHAHHAGLIHRDVKPSNVMLTADGRARLFDFGLTSSNDVDRLTRSGSPLGTLHYMAPEQLRSNAVDARADVYSLGATLHELLTLKAPFHAPDRVALERRVLEGRPDPIRARNRNVSIDAETVCQQAMAPEPGRRYANAREFAKDLQRLLDGMPVDARPPGRFELAVRWAKHHRGATAAAALAILLAAGVPTGLFFLQRSHTRAVEGLLEKEKKALAGEKEARQGEQAALRKVQEAHAAEKLALEDMISSFDMVGSVFVDATSVHTEGKTLTLREGLDRLEKRALEGQDAARVRAQVLSLLGQVRMVGADLRGAKPLIERAEELLRESGYEVSRDRAIALQALGRLRWQERQVDEARELLAEAIEVMEAASDDPRDANFKARTIAYEAMTWSTAETLEKAIDRYADALSAFHPQPGDRGDQEWLAEIGARRAQLLGMAGRKDEAFAELDRAHEALGEWEQAPGPLRMLIVNAEATIAMFSKDLARADSAMKEVVELTRVLFGPVHPALAEQLFKRAQVLVELGKLEEAHALADESCSITDKAFGADSPKSAAAREKVRILFPTE